MAPLTRIVRGEGEASSSRTARLTTATHPTITDGWAPYAETIKASYSDREPSGIRPGWDIRRPTAGRGLTQAIKHRQGRRPEQFEVRILIGESIDLPYAVHLERLKSTLRDHLACLTRTTHAFAKKVTTWNALFGLALFEHNWIRPHIALRCPLAEPVNQCRDARQTPAMALGLADHAWSWTEFLHQVVCVTVRRV